MVQWNGRMPAWCGTPTTVRHEGEKGQGYVSLSTAMLCVR